MRCRNCKDNISIHLFDIFINKGDFGVSKTIEESSMAKTMVGTPYYISPEIIRGDKYPKAIL